MCAACRAATPPAAAALSPRLRVRVESAIPSTDGKGVARHRRLMRGSTPCTLNRAPPRWQVGLTKRGTSAPLGVITAVVPFAAQALGPIVANAVCDAAGPAWSGLVFAALVLVSLVLTLVAHGKFLGVRVPDESNALTPAEAEAEAPKTPSKAG